MLHSADKRIVVPNLTPFEFDEGDVHLLGMGRNLRTSRLPAQPRGLLRCR